MKAKKKSVIFLFFHFPCCVSKIWKKRQFPQDFTAVLWIFIQFLNCHVAFEVSLERGFLPSLSQVHETHSEFPWEVWIIEDQKGFKRGMKTPFSILYNNSWRFTSHAQQSYIKEPSYKIKFDFMFVFMDRNFFPFFTHKFFRFSLNWR